MPAGNPGSVGGEMTGRSLAWPAYAILGGGILCVFLVAAGALGNRLGLLHFSSALGLLRWSAMLAIAVGALAVLLLLASLALRAPLTANLSALLGLVLALAVLLPAYQFKAKAQSVPPIHDISTDTAHPPAFVALMPQRRAAPNGAGYGGPALARQQQAAYPDIQPLRLELPAAAAYGRALAAAEAMGWDIAGRDPREGRIEAVATTFFFGFKDDVVIRVREIAPGASTIDIRSASRVGRGDVGANAERIRGFRARLLSD